MTLTFGSLFAGIGGIDLGLERAGMECRWQVEIDPYATRVLAKHWPNVRRYSDVRTVGAADLDPVDLLAGGFPCQDISHAGIKAGITGARSGLWSEFARLVGELRPRYVLVENVAALLGRGLDVVLGDLAALGFDAEWECIPASAAGAPHIRDRVWIVAYAQSFSERAGLRTNKPPQVRRGRSGDCRGEGNLANTEGVSQELWPATAKRQGRPSSSGDFMGDAHESYGPSSWPHKDQAGAAGLFVGSSESLRSDHWRVEPDVDRVAHGIPARVDRLTGLGNAVVPQVVEYIGRCIVAAEATR